jgi:hypothetical protein
VLLLRWLLRGESERETERDGERRRGREGGRERVGEGVRGRGGKGKCVWEREPTASIRDPGRVVP